MSSIGRPQRVTRRIIQGKRRVASVRKERRTRNLLRNPSGEAFGHRSPSARGRLETNCVLTHGWRFAQRGWMLPRSLAGSVAAWLARTPAAAPTAMATTPTAPQNQPLL